MIVSPVLSRVLLHFCFVGNCTDVISSSKGCFRPVSRFGLRTICGRPGFVPPVSHKLSSELNSYTDKFHGFGMTEVKETDSHGGKGLHIPPRENHRCTIIWMHGLGDTASGWIDFAENLAASGGPFSHCKFVLPTAKSLPVTIVPGALTTAWSDIRGLDPCASEDIPGWNTSFERISTIVRKESDLLTAYSGSKNIILGGFSQGGALSYTVALKDQLSVGGVVCLSGWLPIRDTFSSDAVRSKTDIPMLHCHGDVDSKVNMKWAIKSHEYLTDNLGLNVELKIYKNMDHSACPEELRDVRKFMEGILSRL